VVERVRREIRRSVESAQERAENAEDEEGLARSPHQHYRTLRREVLTAERDALLDARSRGSYPSRILERAQNLLDLEESRLDQMDSGGRLD
jgi:hypothetical protein